MSLELDYELRSRGPASLGADALDKLVSLSRFSSVSPPSPSIRAHSAQPSPPRPPVSAHPAPPPADVMGEQPNAALQATLDALAATLTTLQTSVESNT